MPKKVLFHYPVFNIGGAEMSVLRLMRFLADHGWEVELVLSTGGGMLEPRIDPRVKVTHLRDRVVGRRFLMERHPLRKLLWLALDGFPYICTRLQWLAHALPYRIRQYDLAIISLHGLSPAFCCRWVQAHKRIQWIRNDLALCDEHGKAACNIRRYNQLIDYFVCVSGTTYKSLISLFPELAKKALVIYNVIDAAEMRARASAADNPYATYGDGLNAVTVCRLVDKAKGLFRMLRVHQRLSAEGINFNWFVVGDGPDRDRLAAQIKGCGMEDNFILLGQQENPFPYYKYADISATLSYFEGLCGTVNEAKVLGKPVIATRFSGIEEQLIDGMNGLIVENNEQAIYTGMHRLLTDTTLRLSLTNDFLPKHIRDDENKFTQLKLMVEPGKIENS